jgi:hypothetical protein
MLGGTHVKLGTQVLVFLVLLVGLGAALVVTSVVGPAGPRGAGAEPPLRAIPSDATVVVTLDIDSLRRSGLSKALFGTKSRAAAGADVFSACWLDEQNGLREVALAVAALEKEREPEVMIAASVSGQPTLLLECVERAVHKAGDDVEQSALGEFRLVSARKNPNLALAAREGAPVLLGTKGGLEAMMATLDGKQPSAATNELHQAIRAALRPPADLRASVVLEPRWLERLYGHEAAASPLGSLRTVGVRAALGRTISLEVLLGCALAASCEENAKLARKLVRDLSPELDPETRAAFDRLVVEELDRQVRLTLELRADSIAELWGMAPIPLVAPDR